MPLELAFLDETHSIVYKYRLVIARHFVDLINVFRMYSIVSIQTHFAPHIKANMRTFSGNIDLRIDAHLFKECLFWVYNILRRIGSAKQKFHTVFDKPENHLGKCFEYYVIFKSVWSKNCKARTNLYGRYYMLQDV